ncbi:MAG: sodium/pantothenate symporter [Planctomycetaceae bacterium]
MLLAAPSSNSALWMFLGYTVAVFIIAAFSNRLLKQKEFLGEYFLGSRGLGMWAFALTFAATSASGGTFTGFPAKIYSHGWILALWIASYMVYPLCTMGILGKRINQVARKSNAITVPDVLRDRFESPCFGLVSTLLILFFLSVNLIAQFKAGAVILQTLVQDVDLFHQARDWTGNQIAGIGFFDGVQPGYLLCLILFGISVIVYTTYGGFHAVVWTDVMQGIVMVIGVLIMLPLAISQVGGMEAGTRKLAEMEPKRKLVQATVVNPVGHSGSRMKLSKGERIVDVNHPHPSDKRVLPLYEVAEPTFLDAATPRDDVMLWWTPSTSYIDDPSGTVVPGLFPLGPRRLQVHDVRSPVHGFVSGPGPSGTLDGFLPLGMAISFFFMWAISGSGQPQYWVRLMAFKDSTTLRRAIITVTLYYALIYLPLVIIFVFARILVPGMEDKADQIMPTMAVTLTHNAGVPWLAGLLIAAPFAAVMSTVDSYLLVISSSAVRDIYQRTLNPDASEKTIKRLSFLTTLVIGSVALIYSINPPKYLQDIIVYVGSGLACCFLFPMVAALYWPRANLAGCLSGMLVGFAVHLAPHVIAKLQGGSFANPVSYFGLEPLLLGLAASLVTVLVVTPLTHPPAEHLVLKYFYKAESAS